MSAFQDFGPLSERRRAERAQSRRKQIMMAGGALSVIIIVAAVAAVAVVYVNKTNKKDASGSFSSTAPKQSSAIVTSTQMVEAVCSETDRPKACTASLSARTNATSKPKDVVKAAVSAVYDEVGEAFGKSSLVGSEDPLVKGAVEVCERLLNDSRSDLMDTISRIEISKAEDLPRVGPVLNVWISAVRSYQETCVDAFPEGESRDKMKAAMEEVNGLTNNALAVVSKVGTFLLALNVPGPELNINRRLLSAEEEVDEEGFPGWVEEGERRVLRASASAGLKPDLVVAKDGSGQFATINDALQAVPSDYTGRRFVIYVKAGIYNEIVLVDKKFVNLTMYGDGNTKTIVTGNLNFKDGVQTFKTATFAVNADGFMGLNMGFQNTAGPEGEQAVALRVQGDSAVFLNCRMDAYQDTLYAQAKRQFYRNCIITGTVDYIFGDSAAVFQGCVMAIRRPGPGQQNIVTAHGKVSALERTGFVLHNCRIIAADDLKPVAADFRSYLARPWKAFSTTVVMESEIEGVIDPAGYLPWGDTVVGQDTCTYAEYGNRGAGADTSRRAAWKGVRRELSKQEARGYTPAVFLVDVAYWSKKSGVPVPLRRGFFKN